jgi:hypothetical protein
MPLQQIFQAGRIVDIGFDDFDGRQHDQVFDRFAPPRRYANVEAARGQQATR